VKRLIWLCLLLACLSGGVALAATNPDEMLKDPVLEARARALSKQLRCLVCQNQSIDDSDADLARDLRRIVRVRLVAGDSDQQIIGFLTARYGDFVLLRPPLEPATWGLWFGPGLLLVIAAGGIGVYLIRRRRGQGVPAPLSAEERARLDQLLRGEQAPDRP
jgi:cytochrome c-type biogenesis protein CcmH